MGEEMKKTNDVKIIQAEFEEFLQAPPPTEKDKEYEINFEVACLKAALNREQEANNILPRTDEKIKMSKDCSKYLTVIEEWQESKGTHDIILYKDILDIPGVREVLGSDSILRNKLLPMPKPQQQSTQNEESSTHLCDTEGGDKLITNSVIKAHFEPACLNTVFSWAKKAKIKIENIDGKNVMMVKDANALKAAHQKYYDKKRRELKKTKK